jgi:hypothetical protein
LPDDAITRWENEGGALAPPPVEGSQKSSLAETRDEREEIGAEEDADASSFEVEPGRPEPA